MAGYYDTASGQWIEDNASGQGQMPGEVDHENPYEVGTHERKRIDYHAGQADEFSSNYYQQVAEGGGYGQAMLDKGLGQAQSAMQAQAVSRGANPLQERAAVLGGGKMMREGAVDAAGIRAQEMNMAAQARQAQMNQTTAMEQWHEQMERQRQMADQGHYGQMAGLEAGEDQAQAQMAMQGVSMGMSAAGTAGMASDIKLKDGSCIPATDLTDQAVSGFAEPAPAYHGITVDDGQGPTRYTSRFGTAGNSPLKEMPERYTPDALPGGGAGVAAYRPTADSGPVNGTPQTMALNPDVERVAISSDPVGEMGRMQAAYAATKSALDDGGGGGMGGAGGMVAGLASDIRLKDGTCVPRSSLVDQQTAALSGALDRAGAETGRQMGWAPSPGDRQAADIYAQLSAEGARTDAELDRTSSHLQPKTWSYKPEAQQAMGLPGGKRVGPMAQDLERSELGKLAVVETPAGKAIDRDGALGLSLGLHGRHGERDDEIDRRVSALEKALKREGKRTESKL